MKLSDFTGPNVCKGNGFNAWVESAVPGAPGFAYIKVSPDFGQSYNYVGMGPRLKGQRLHVEHQGDGFVVRLQVPTGADGKTHAEAFIQALIDEYAKEAP